MSTRLFVNLSQVFIPLYLHETLNMAASALALIPLIMFVGSFITTMAIEKLNRRLGRGVSIVVHLIKNIQLPFLVFLRVWKYNRTSSLYLDSFRIWC